MMVTITEPIAVLYGKQLASDAVYKVTKVTKDGKVYIYNRDMSNTDTPVRIENCKPIIIAVKNPKIGDIYAMDWGYGQIQTWWYKIIAVSDKFVKVKKLNETRQYSNHLYGEATVNVNDESGNIDRFKIHYDFNGNSYFKPTSFGYASKVDPSKPRYFSETH